MGAEANDELRILLAIRTMAHGGGAEELVFNTYNELKKRPGIKVKLVSFQRSEIFGMENIHHYEEQLAGDPDFHFCKCYANISVLKPITYDVKEFMEIVHAFKPHVIHSHMFLADLYSHIELVPARYFSHCHDNFTQLEKFSLRSLTSKLRFTNLFERKFILKKYEASRNHFFAISGDTYNYFKSVLPASLKENVTLFPNAINFEKFNAVNYARKNSPIRIANISRFVVHKNQVFLVEIMKRLKERGVDATLTFMGSGREMETVKGKAREYGLDKQITFAGNVARAQDYLKEANIYVHSAYYEPFGLVLLEAMAAGLPVITLDGKGNRDLVKDGENGFFIEEQNADLFADKIIALKNDPLLYQNMSQRAVEFAKGFDIKNYVGRLLEFYQAVN